MQKQLYHYISYFLLLVQGTVLHSIYDIDDIGIGLLMITSEKEGSRLYNHFVLLHHQSMSTDMLNLNQH